MGIMRQWFSLLLLGSLLIFLVPGVPAFTAGQVNIVPSGSINPGDPVNISATVYAASGVAFPSYDDLQFITELDDPQWTYTILVNGVANPRAATGGRILTVNGFELGYTNQDEVLVTISLKGHVPVGSPVGLNRTLLKIQELDARGNAIPYSMVTLDHLIGQPTPTPTPSIGRISILSEPAGANIYLDNTYRGLTPVILSDVPNGNHDVLIRQEGYQDYSRSVIVTADNQTIDATLIGRTAVPTSSSTPRFTGTGTVVPTAVPTHGYGSLSVATSPPGVLVSVDGVTRGVSPAMIPMLAEGPHTVILSLDGYQNLSTTILITPGATSEFTTGLQKSAQSPGFTVLAPVLAIGLLLLFRREWK